MDNQRINVLYVHYGDNGIRGSEICLLNLLGTIDRSQYQPILWCNSSILAEQVRALGIEVIESTFSLLFGWQAPRYNFQHFGTLYKKGCELIDTHNISIVHCNSAAPCQWMSIACLRTQTKLLTHLHAPYPLRDRFTLGLHCVDKVVCVNSHIQNQLLEDGCPQQRLKVIANGLDIKRLKKTKTIPVRALLGIAESELLLSCVNYLDHAKGTDICIKMLAQLHVKHNIKAHIMIIGKGPLLKALMREADTLGIKKYVHFMGESPNVQSLIQENSDLYVCGSREESFGLAIAEAAVAKLPIVAPDVGGIPMIIKHGLTGLLYQSEDIATFAKDVALLLSDRALAEQLSEQAYHHVVTQFNLANYTEQFSECYQQIARQSTKAKLSVSIAPFFRVLSVALNSFTKKLGFSVTASIK